MERCDMLAGWLDLVLGFLPECEAGMVPGQRKLLTREQLLENPYKDGLRFLYFGVNARFLPWMGQGGLRGGYAGALCGGSSGCSVSISWTGPEPGKSCV